MCRVVKQNFDCIGFPHEAGRGQVVYLCTVAALRVVVVLGSQLAVCVFIRGYTVIVMLVVINAQIQWI